ncbi:hypothetical protein AADZ90_020840 [Aestuariibius sp. 2305UL40-4]
MQVATVGLDLARSGFHGPGVAEDGQAAFNRPFRRRQGRTFFEQLEPCRIGVEACASRHDRARELSTLGRTVRLMPPMYVKPDVKCGKERLGNITREGHTRVSRGGLFQDHLIEFGISQETLQASLLLRTSQSSTQDHCAQTGRVTRSIGDLERPAMRHSRR